MEANPWQQNDLEGQRDSLIDCRDIDHEDSLWEQIQVSQVLAQTTGFYATFEPWNFFLKKKKNRNWSPLYKHIFLFNFTTSNFLGACHPTK